MAQRPIVLKYPRRARASRLCLLAALGACSVGPNFKRPEPPAAERYTSDTPSVETSSAATQHLVLGKEIEGDWWSLFGSEMIDRIVQQALEHNRTLEAAPE